MLRNDFEAAREGVLENISSDSSWIFLCILLPTYLIHLLLVLLQAASTVAPFRDSCLLDKATHIAASLFMVTTCRDGGRGDRRMEVKQESFQLLLHLVGNLVMMYASKVYCSQGDLDQIFIFTFDLYFILPVLLSNLLAAGILVFYHTRSDLPQLWNMGSFSRLIFIFSKVSPKHSAFSQFVLCGCLILKLFLFSL